jgi:hypothetical protein
MAMYTYSMCYFMLNYFFQINRFYLNKALKSKNKKIILFIIIFSFPKMW